MYIQIELMQEEYELQELKDTPYTPCKYKKYIKNIFMFLK